MPTVKEVAKRIVDQFEQHQSLRQLMQNTLAAIIETEAPALIPKLPECCCGNPLEFGVVHRKDGPCFIPQTISTVRDQMISEARERLKQASHVRIESDLSDTDIGIIMGTTYMTPLSRK